MLNIVKWKLCWILNNVMQYWTILCWILLNGTYKAFSPRNLLFSTARFPNKMPMGTRACTNTFPGSCQVFLEKWSGPDGLLPRRAFKCPREICANLLKCCFDNSCYHTTRILTAWLKASFVCLFILVLDCPAHQSTVQGSIQHNKYIWPIH